MSEGAEPTQPEATLAEPAEPTGGTTPAAGARARSRAAPLPARSAAETPAEPSPESGAAPGPVLPTLGDPPGPIIASDDLAVAARKAMWTHVARLLERELTILDPEHPDDLRRYRVAVRRLRAATRLFRDALPGRELRALRHDLSQLADTIGRQRDLENRIADLRRWAKERAEGEPGDGARPGSEAAVAPLLEAWEGEQVRLRADLAVEMASRHHRRLLVRLAELVDATSAKADDDVTGDAVGDRVASRLWAAYEDVRAYSRVLRWADLETLHQLRIAAKRLRDSLDLLGDLVGPERTWLTERLVLLQDHLGATNDAAVTARAVRAYLEGHHQRLTPAEASDIAAYLTDRERTVARLRRGVGRPWRAVSGITFARRLSRIVVIRPSAPTRG